MTIIKDMISGLVICVNNHDRALATAKKRVEYHNSTFAYSHRGIHYPANAYLEEKENEIIIKQR